MQIENQKQGWLIVPPSYRFDINIEADLIEEIGRLIGYNNIPGTKEAAHSSMESFSETERGINEIKDVLVTQGFYEAVTYSFVSPEMQAILDPHQETLTLSNPISTDMSVMRTRLLPGLIQAFGGVASEVRCKVATFTITCRLLHLTHDASVDHRRLLGMRRALVGKRPGVHLYRRGPPASKIECLELRPFQTC